MGRRSIFLAFPLVLLVSAAAFVNRLDSQSKPLFIPPDVTTAGDLNYPANSSVSGVVAVAVGLDGDGKVKSTDTLLDIPSLTASVLLSVAGWTFSPARLDGKGVDSTIVVDMVFNPGDYQRSAGNMPTLGREMRVLGPDAIGFLPPTVVSAPWADYPLNSTPLGSVILDCHVGSDGSVARVSTVSIVASVPPLTAASLRAAKNWKFTPATFGGAPAPANVVVGYVFRPPNIAKPLVHP